MGDRPVNENASNLDGVERAVYTYDPRRYAFDVKVPAILAAIVLPIALVFAYMGALTPIALGVAILCAYVLFNTFAAHAYPRTVSLDGSTLTLSSFGRTDEYRLADITRLQVRENGMTRNAYIRVNGGGLVRGRYFVACGDLYDVEGAKALDLYQFFLDTEARLDPDNLRVRSRAANARRESSRGESPKSR